MFTAPAWNAAALVGLALPLFLVTMAAQNVPGMAVLAGFGYRPPFGGALRATGLVSRLAAPVGGHAVNLAAITAALAAGPDAHPDPDRRWVASVTAGVGCRVGLGAGGHRAGRCRPRRADRGGRRAGAAGRAGPRWPRR